MRPIYPSASAAVHFRIAHAAYAAVTTSVTGMANHKLSAPNAAGSTKISTPLMTSPRATDTTNAACGLRIA